jgi:putative transposase
VEIKKDFCLGSTVSLAQFMQHVKSGSSRFFSETLKPGAWFAWQGSYGAFAVSLRDREKIIAYLGNQKQHHADGAL